MFQSQTDSKSNQKQPFDSFFFPLLHLCLNVKQTNGEKLKETIKETVIDFNRIEALHVIFIMAEPAHT